MYKIEKTAEAEIDLIDIWVHTLEQWSLEQADKYTDELDEVLTLLASNPLICRDRPEYLPPVRIHHHGRHLIVYTIEGDHILIVRVLYDSVDLSFHLGTA